MTAMFLVGTIANAATLSTAPRIFDTGLKATTGQITNLTFALFDPTLGLLTGVHLQLDGYGVAGYSFSDLSGNSNSVQFTASVKVKVANPSDPSNPLP